VLKAVLTALRIAWPVWVFLALVVAARLAYGLCRWRLISKSGMKNIDAMSGRNFERYLEILFTKLGYRVNRTSYQGDYGADLVVTKDGVKTAIQAKRAKRRIGVKAVQEAVAAKGYYSCDKAMVVTNSFFTHQAATLAHRNRVLLWNRNRLAKAMDSVGGKRVIAQAIAPEEPAPSQPAMFSADVDASPSGAGAVCAICGQRVPEKVRDYCLANERRFSGQILCYRHQRTR
jgi:restriction system protein